MSTYLLNQKYDFLISKKNLFSISEEIVKNTTDTTIVVPNACNINNNIISKFSSLAYQKYPIIHKNLLINHQNKIGTNIYISVYVDKNSKNQIIYANMFCENKTGKSKRHINYGALAMCMLDTNRYCKDYIRINPDKKIQIHSPKFGTGFSGGDWKTIANLINDIWSKNFTTFIYEPELIN